MSMENLKKVISFGMDTGAAIMEAVEAPTPLGKAAAMLHLLEDAPMLMGVDYKALESEFKMLTPEELDELCAYVDTNLPIADVEKKAKVEAALSVVVDLAKVVEKAVAMWKAHEAPAPVAAS